MPLIQLVVVLIVVGVLLWLVNNYIPMDGKIKRMATVLLGVNDIRVEEVERPRAGVGEAVIRITLTTICGTDHIKSQQPEAVVIMITGNVQVDNTISALRGGAYDFIGKPINL